MEIEHLLPCPFCGGEAYILESSYKPNSNTIYEYKAYCGQCNAESGAWSGAASEAANAWNTRCVDGHVVTFHWTKPGVIGPTAVWVVCDDWYMYGPYEKWQDVEKAIREEWKSERNLVG
jgi:Lar family restriction alleviation protein